MTRPRKLHVLPKKYDAKAEDLRRFERILEMKTATKSQLEKDQAKLMWDKRQPEAEKAEFELEQSNAFNKTEQERYKIKEEFARTESDLNRRLEEVIEREDAIEAEEDRPRQLSVNATFQPSVQASSQESQESAEAKLERQARQQAIIDEIAQMRNEEARAADARIQKMAVLEAELKEGFNMK